MLFTYRSNNLLVVVLSFYYYNGTHLLILYSGIKLLLVKLLSFKTVKSDPNSTTLTFLVFSRLVRMRRSILLLGGLALLCLANVVRSEVSIDVNVVVNHAVVVINSVLLLVLFLLS